MSITGETLALTEIKEPGAVTAILIRIRIATG